MTTRETLHQLVDQLQDEQAELARVWLEDLRDAADADGPPLDAATIASLGGAPLFSATSMHRS